MMETLCWVVIVILSGRDYYNSAYLLDMYYPNELYLHLNCASIQYTCMYKHGTRKRCREDDTVQKTVGTNRCQF